MSWDTTFYLGIMDKDKKIRPLGPFNHKGEYRDVFYTSRSFTTDLKEDFYPIKWEQMTDELHKEFSFKSPNDEMFQFFEYLPLSELPNGEYIKRGYFLREQVNAYLEDEDTTFYNVLTPEQYAFKLENELKFGPPKPKKDCEGEEYIEPSCADYVYFSYPEYQSKEFEAYILRFIASTLVNSWELEDGEQIVVIKTEG